jgi:hypothetical protein
MTVGFMRWQQPRRDPGRPWYPRYDWERCNRAIALQGIRSVSRRTRHHSAASGTPANDHRAKVLRTLSRVHALNHRGAID